MKLILLAFVFFIVVGCTPLDSLTEEEIIERIIERNITHTNQHRTGYSYYLPRGLTIIESGDFNEIARGGGYLYYIFIDVVSYYNGVRIPYQINEDAYLSMVINHGEKFGYLEINRINNKYHIEIMYNYAKIEVIVNRRDIKLAIANSITILSTIRYNDIILSNLMGENILDFNEREFNIFDTKNNVESGYVTAAEAQEEYKEEIPDPDLIR